METNLREYNVVTTTVETINIKQRMLVVALNDEGGNKSSYLALSKCGSIPVNVNPLASR